MPSKNFVHDELTFKDLVPFDMARIYRVFPINFRRGIVSLACGYALSQEQSKNICEKLSSEIEWHIRDEEWIIHRLEGLYEMEVPRNSTDSDSIWSSYSIFPFSYEIHDKGVDITASGFDSDGTHWSGSIQINAYSSDYRFYTWLIENPAYHRKIGGRELPAIKKAWESQL